MVIGRRECLGMALLLQTASATSGSPHCRVEFDQIGLLSLGRRKTSRPFFRQFQAICPWTEQMHTMRMFSSILCYLPGLGSLPFLPSVGSWSHLSRSHQQQWMIGETTDGFSLDYGLPRTYRRVKDSTEDPEGPQFEHIRKHLSL